jgi:hypothetical protein
VIAKKSFYCSEPHPCLAKIAYENFANKHYAQAMQQNQATPLSAALGDAMLATSQ